MIRSNSTQFYKLKVKTKKKIKKQDVKEQLNVTQKKGKQVKIVDQQILVFIEQPLKDYLCFFINGDILVEIARNNDYLYESQTAQIWNSIKPLIYINHNLQKNLLHLNFDCTPTFIQLDYQLIINMMRSMQDKEFFEYSLLLEELQKELQIYKKQKIEDSQISKQLKYLEFQNFINNDLSFIIESIVKNEQYFNYAVYSCIEGLDNKSLAQYTLSKSIVEVIHGPIEGYKTLLQRNGWREHIELEQRRQFSKYQIDQIKKSLFKINNKNINFQDEFKVSTSQLQLKTTDGFDCPMIVQEFTVLKYFKDDIMAIINVIIYQIEQEVIDSIQEYRDISQMQSEQSQTLRQMELYDMSQYEYFLEAEKFVKKYNFQ
ncbi:hypothetical protein ABPG74_019567 [Tetrahymena malaccensis]